MKELQNFTDKLIGNLVLLVLIATTFVLWGMFRNLNVTVQEMSKKMIEDRLSLTKHELSNIFDPIIQNLSITREQGRRGVLSDLTDIPALNAVFIPFIKSSPTVSSLMLADEDGNEYMLLDVDSLWIVRITHSGSEKDYPTDYFFERGINGYHQLIKKEKHQKKYDPRNRPWFRLAIDNPSDSAFSWTNPYIFFTTRQPGITGSARFTDPKSGKKYVIGMDVLIASLSDFTTHIDVTKNGKIFVLSENYEVIGLPRDSRFTDEETLEEYNLKLLKDLQIPLLIRAMQEFENNQAGELYHNFQFENDRWWGGLASYRLSNDNNLLVGAVVPESDFSGEIAQTRKLLIGGLALILLFFLIILYSFFKMKKANKIIAREKDKNEQLLLNTLPAKVVNDLKTKGISEPQNFKNVTVCFADIVGFTKITTQLRPKELITELNDLYTAFDDIVIKYDCERIKTMGDAYMAVCGMPEENPRHAAMMLQASLEIFTYLNQRNKSAKHTWQMRIGLHSGATVGGIVGIKKYIYDVFGDTINTASRMESYSETMRINISEQTYLLVKDDPIVHQKNLQFVTRPPISVKGKGDMNMFFVDAK